MLTKIHDLAKVVLSAGILSLGSFVSAGEYSIQDILDYNKKVVIGFDPFFSLENG